MKISKKKIKQYYPVVFILLIIIGIGIYSYTVIPVSKDKFYQYTSDSCGSAKCEFIPEFNLLTSNEASFRLDGGTLKFITIVRGSTECGINTATTPPTVIKTCCADINVYKDDLLIDTLKLGYSGNLAGDNTVNMKNYYIANQGVRINAKTNSQFYIDSCVRWENQYDLLLDDLDIKSSFSKLQYKVNDPINLNIKINSSINTPASLTVISDTLNQQDINLVNGINNYDISFPSNIIKEVPVVPRLVVNFASNRVTGVNYDYGLGHLSRIGYKEFITLADINDNALTLKIGNDDIPIPTPTSTPNPSPTPCSGNNCNEDYSVYMIIGVIAVFFAGLSFIYWKSIKKN